MFGREKVPDARGSECSICRQVRTAVPVMRRAGEGDQKQDDPEYVIRVCDRCDRIGSSG